MVGIPVLVFAGLLAAAGAAERDSAGDVLHGAFQQLDEAMHVTPCQVDADCKGGFCAQGRGPSKCLAFQAEGQSCGGFTMYPSRCSPGLVCQPSPQAYMIPDLPGTCAKVSAGCTADVDCPNGFCFNSQCKAFQIEGQPCGGMTREPSRCAPDLTCEGQQQMYDAPGTCTKAPAGCTTDADCSDGFCWQGRPGQSKCLAFKTTGQSCGGYTMYPSRCSPGLVCQPSPQADMIPDLPGTCAEVSAGEGAMRPQPPQSISV